MQNAIWAPLCQHHSCISDFATPYSKVNPPLPLQCIAMCGEVFNPDDRNVPKWNFAVLPQSLIGPINVFCSWSCYLLRKHFSDENFPWWTGWHLTHHNFCPQGFKVSWKIILMDRYHWLRQELPTHWCARPPDFWFFTQLNYHMINTTQCNLQIHVPSCAIVLWILLNWASKV